jgi:hypothetical protein
MCPVSRQNHQTTKKKKKKSKRKKKPSSQAHHSACPLPPCLVAWLLVQSTTEEEQRHNANTHLVHITHKHKDKHNTLPLHNPCLRPLPYSRQHHESASAVWQSTSDLPRPLNFTNQIHHASNKANTPVACRTVGRPSGQCNRPPKDRTKVPGFDIPRGKRWQ